MSYDIEIEQRRDGSWLAKSTHPPRIMRDGATQHEAIANLEAALNLLGDFQRAHAEESLTVEKAEASADVKAHEQSSLDKDIFTEFEKLNYPD